jgi:spermidine synthase
MEARGGQSGVDVGLALWLAGLGALATGGQVLLMRELMTVFAGNELSLGLAFGAWFAGIALGAWPGGWLADRLGRAGARAWLAGLGTALPLVLLGLVGLMRLWRGLLGVPPGALPGLGPLVASAPVLVVPLSALVGLLFPLACRAAAAAAGPPERRVIGRVYLLESLGAILGGLLPAGLTLLGLLPMEIIGVLGAAGLLGAGLVWSSVRRRRLLAWTLGGGGLVLGLLATGALGAWDRALVGARFAGLDTGGRLVASAATPYQHLDLAEAEGQLDLYADGKLVGSFPDSYRLGPRLHLVLTQHPAPRSALVLAEAPAGLAAPASSHSLERLDIVSLDPGVPALLAPHLPPGEHADARVRLHLADGRRFLQTRPERWDVIFADAPDPVTLAQNRFHTREFFRLARARLAPGGVLAVRMGSQVGQLDRDTAGAVRTQQLGLAAVFQHVLVLPGSETFLLASDDPRALLSDPHALFARHRARGVSDPDFHPGVFSQLVQADQVEDLAHQLAAHGPAPANTDARPVATLQGLVRWSRETGDRVAAVLLALGRVPAWPWAVGLALVVLAALGLRRPGRAGLAGAQRALAAGSVALVGGLGLALSLVVTFAYQSLAGSLYLELGLLVAAFMAGLLLGGGLLLHLQARPASARSLALGLGLAALFAALLPALLELAARLPLPAGQALMLALNGLAGALTGVIFPLASQLSLQAGQALGRAAGGLDALDHLGAAAAAVLTGLVWLPGLGRLGTCLVLASTCLVVAAWAGLVHRAEARPGAGSRSGDEP